ncbi:MAG: ferrous iron transport protein B [Bacteroidota bacterium]
MSNNLKIALIGNPNSGKSTVFNALTGLNQKVANFPGVTVDKRTGTTVIRSESGEAVNCEFIDLPGTYSLYPKSPDEQIPFQLLCNPDHELHPDLSIVVADGTNLKRNLFLCSQLIDLRIRVILVINMMDIVRARGTDIDLDCLSKKLGVTIVPMNARRSDGLEELKRAIVSAQPVSNAFFLDTRAFAPQLVDRIREEVRVNSDYNAFLVANNLGLIETFALPEFKREKIREACQQFGYDPQQMQARESLERYKAITNILQVCVRSEEHPVRKSGTYKIDSILTHRVFGYLIFLFILFLIFQAIFAWATYPMDLIDRGFATLSQRLHDNMAPGLLTDLLIDGILAGLNGIVVFIPQIALLFFFVAILEDSGYMARVSFLMDRLMRRFGLNGKSMIPLMSGVACAVPALMSTRTIQNRKERLITILVTPLMSCSARLPVYTLLIALVIPNDLMLGMSMQGLVLMGLYLLGFVSALFAALVFKYMLRSKERSFFVMEMPLYRLPRFSTVFLHILEKVKIFLFDAGKIIIAISIVLWFLSSFAPGNAFEQIEATYRTEKMRQLLPAEELEHRIQTEKLETSYAGRLGHFIEPVIKPLGFDWKIGIALITSFAAREVFVGTMSTIYSVGDEESASMTVKQKMRGEINPDTGGPRYTLAVGLSLMLFYAFAMQCMSTVATVFRETRRLKYPVFQVVYMSGMAYLASLIAYQLLKP